MSLSTWHKCIMIPMNRILLMRLYCVTKQSMTHSLELLIEGLLNISDNF